MEVMNGTIGILWKKSDQGGIERRYIRFLLRRQLLQKKSDQGGIERTTGKDDCIGGRKKSDQGGIESVGGGAVECDGKDRRNQTKVGLKEDDGRYRLVKKLLKKSDQGGIESVFIEVKTEDILN